MILNKIKLNYHIKLIDDYFKSKNFLEAKNLGAKYVISRHRINNINLELIPLSFKNDIFFYEIDR